MLSPTAGSYVVRKISAALKQGEQPDQPVLTPCSLAKGKKELYAGDAALMSNPEPEGVAGSSAFAPAVTAVQNCGS
ncbi:hypothetical protein IRJ41_015418 [Triplophysa rosa]|uniref:Uncharacterized protein n=1 Tax=Triplophysa rosa TaxID=992332 RepID=A0A9W7WUH2_TRIRA|nr:hypothetical protein IRJ41_015418 [Triplophysa rosa]